MDVKINISQETANKAPNLLDELRSILINSDVKNVEITERVTTGGEKDAGLTLALGICGLTVSAIGGLFSILSYFKSRNKTLKIRAMTDRKEVTIESFNQNELKATITDFQEDDIDILTIHIS